MQPFRQKIDERVNERYAEDYSNSYGNLTGWTKFQTPNQCVIGEYRNGEPCGNALVKNYDNLDLFSNELHADCRAYEDFMFPDKSALAFVFYRDEHSHFSGPENTQPLHSLERCFGRFNLESQERNNFAFFAGFSERVVQLFFLFRVKERFPNPIIFSFGGQGFSSKWLFDYSNITQETNTWQDHLSQRWIKLQEENAGLEGDVWESSFISLITTIAVHNWALRAGVMLEFELPKIKLLGEYSQVTSNPFTNQRVLDHVDSQLLSELSDEAEISADHFLNSLATLNLRLGGSFKRNWILGCSVADGYLGRDMEFTQFLLDYCFSPILTSSEHFIDSTLGVVTAHWCDDIIKTHPKPGFNVLIENADMVIPETEFVAPLSCLKHTSILIRCLTNALLTEAGTPLFHRKRLGIIIRLLDDEFCKEALILDQYFRENLKAEIPFDFLIEKHVNRCMNISSFEQLTSERASAAFLSNLIMQGSLKEIYKIVGLASYAEDLSFELLNLESTLSSKEDSISYRAYVEEYLEPHILSIDTDAGLAGIMWQYDSAMTEIVSYIKRCERMSLVIE